MERNLPGFNRDTLHKRHRLSYQQIGDRTGVVPRELIIEEKIHQLNMVLELSFIASALRRAAIWFVPLKGPLLSYRIYGDATYRRFSDLDFLVRPDDAHQAIGLLFKSGYKPLKFVWPVKPGHQKTVIREINQFALYHPTAGLKVEIHWKLFPLPVARYKKVGTLVTENLTEIRYAGHTFLQFTPEFELLYLVIHGGLHAWSRLKWLEDVKIYANKISLSSDKMETLAHQLNAGRMIGLCNALLRHFHPDTSLLPAGRHVPEWMVGYVLDRIALPAEVAGSSKKHFLAFLRYRWMAFPGCVYKYRAATILTFSMDHPDRYRIPLYPLFRIAGLLTGFLFRCLTGRRRNDPVSGKNTGLSDLME